MRAYLSSNLPRAISLLDASCSPLYPTPLNKIMDIQEFLTYFINNLILSSILFFLIDFYFYLLNSWQQLNPSAQPDFYQQVKDSFWDKDTRLVPCTP